MPRPIPPTFSCVAAPPCVEVAAVEADEVPELVLDPVVDDAVAVAEDPVPVEAHVAVCGRSVTPEPLQIAFANWMVPMPWLELSHEDPPYTLTVLISFVACLRYATREVCEEFVVCTDTLDVDTITVAEVSAHAVAGTLRKSRNAGCCDVACQKRGNE